MENSSIDSFALRVSAARFDYEYAGFSVEAIAEKHHLPLASVRQEISEAGWVVKASSCDLVPPESAQQSPSPHEPSNLLSDTRQRVDILDAYRIQEHLPYAIAAQKLVLVRSFELLSSTPATADYAYLKVLKGVHEIVESILQKIPSAFTPEDGSSPAKTAPVQVLIQNNIQ